MCPSMSICDPKNCLADSLTHADILSEIPIYHEIFLKKQTEMSQNSVLLP